MSCATGRALPNANTPREHVATPAEDTIERQEVCVGSLVKSAGAIAPKLYYRRAWLPDGRLAVGYYAFFSEERPWGNNWMTWLVVPAVALDLVYTRTLFVAPGIQRVAYGKGDVEGFRIIYRVDDSGDLVVDHAVADDSTHHPTLLTRADLLSVDRERPTVYADAWNHHLGARGATTAKQLAFRRCYGKGAIVPLTDQISHEFRLATRAKPADVGPETPRPQSSERAIARRSDAADLRR